MLQIVSSNRAVALAEHLAGVLAEPPADPFEPEWIAVPSEGMRRWLALELARHLGGSGPGATDGVAANITNAFPGSLRSRILAAERPEDEPDSWELERLAWVVLAVIDDAGSDRLLEALAQFETGASRYSRARRLADLFDRYHLHRPDMIRAWAGGRDVDGTGRPLDARPDGATHRWQPHLWRLVRARVGSPSPPERLPGLLERLSVGDLDVDLPARATLFGLSVLPGGAGFVELARAVSVHRDLHVFLLDPSPATSAAIAASVAPDQVGVRLRSGDRSADLVDHPLVRSWGRLPRETATVLAAARARSASVPDVTRIGAGPTAGQSGGPTAPPTVLAQLQADVIAGRAPTERPELDLGDGSVQFHATHGPARQVEVLRDALLHLLADDPTLDEDDIVVLCPDLERFAPFVEAAFGPSSDVPSPAPRGSGAPRLRYRVADRGVAATNPMVAALEALLELAVGRFDAPTVLDLLAQPAVRARYRFTAEELGQIDDWVGATNVRWGLDPDHRLGHGVDPTVSANSWQAGIDRLLLGAAVADDEPGISLGEVVPLGIEGDEVDLAGRLADLFGHLGRLAAATVEVHPLATWLEILGELVDALLAPVDGETRQRDALIRALAEIAEHATGPDGPASTPLAFVDLRRLVVDRFAGRRGRPDFFRGGMTVTSPDALRSVPFRVVALLGMDQSAFASTAVSNDDLMAAAAMTGDGDPRADARQAILDGVLSAREHLIVLRDGHDLRTNQVIPPAVVVAELIDAVRATGGAPAGGGSASERPALVEHVHPRQAFDERAFTAGGVVVGRPWSFDRAAREGATARRNRRPRDTAFLAAPLASATPGAPGQAVIELEDLHRFLAHPVQWFLERRLQIEVPRTEEAHPTRLPVDLVMLDRWKVGDRLLRTVLDGGDPDRWEHLARLEGRLPPGVLGTEKARELRAQVQTLAEAAQALGVRPELPERLAVDVTLPDGTRVLGTVEDRLTGNEPGSALVGFGGAKPKHRLAAWLDVVALTATDPDVDWRAVAVFSDKSKSKAEVTELLMASPPTERGAKAVEALALVVDWYRRGQREPLPYFPTLSPELHAETAKPHLWTSTRGFPDGRDRFVALVFGHLSWDELLALPAQPEDPGHGTGRVLRLATHLWSAVEATVEDRAESVAAT